MVIILVGRFIGIIAIFYLFRLCFRKKTINFNELMFICWGGMIRGAIAFALVLKIPTECAVATDCYSAEQYELATSTTLVIVMITTVFFGTFMKWAQGCLLGKPKDEAHVDMDELLNADASSKKSMHYETIQHPNLTEVEVERSRSNTMIKREEQEFEGTFANGRCSKWFASFDETKLRPFLIRNYTIESIMNQDKYNDMITKNVKPDQLEGQMNDIRQHEESTSPRGNHL